MPRTIPLDRIETMRIHYLGKDRQVKHQMDVPFETVHSEVARLRREGCLVVKTKIVREKQA